MSDVIIADLYENLCASLCLRVSVVQKKEPRRHRGTEEHGGDSLGLKHFIQHRNRDLNFFLRDRQGRRDPQTIGIKKKPVSQHATLNTLINNRFTGIKIRKLHRHPQSKSTDLLHSNFFQETFHTFCFSLNSFTKFFFQ